MEFKICRDHPGVNKTEYKSSTDPSHLDCSIDLGLKGCTVSCHDNMNIEAWFIQIPNPIQLQLSAIFYPSFLPFNKPESITNEDELVVLKASSLNQNMICDEKKTSCSFVFLDKQNLIKNTAFQ